MCPTDGLWVITLGQFGIAAVIALTATITLPAVLLVIRTPMRLWDHPIMATAAPLAVLLLVHMCDNLLNAMVNPIYILAAGGLSALGPSLRKLYKQYRLQQAQAAAQGFPVMPTFPTVGNAAGGYGPHPGYPAPSAYGGPVAGVARTTWQR
jgi:hypothetical protein